MPSPAKMSPQTVAGNVNLNDRVVKPMKTTWSQNYNSEVTRQRLAERGLKSQRNIFQNGDYYAGQVDVVSGQRKGSGRLREENQDLYVGDWKEDMKHGLGSTYTRCGPHKGSRYEGGFARDEMSGHGTYRNNTGAVYQGQYKEGCKEGWGSLAFPEGDLYEGEWKSDKFDGHGTMRWKAGAMYEGQWKAGEYSGLGELRWADGSRYEGSWKGGEPQTGTMWYPNGIVRDFKRSDDIKYHRLLAMWPQHKTQDFIKVIESAKAGDPKAQAIADFSFGVGWEKRNGISA